MSVPLVPIGYTTVEFPAPASGVFRGKALNPSWSRIVVVTPIPESDPPSFPRIVLFPRVETVRSWLREARTRVGDAVDVLRHGTPDYPEDSW